MVVNRSVSRQHGLEEASKFIKSRQVFNQNQLPFGLPRLRSCGESREAFGFSARKLFMPRGFCLETRVSA